jgi:flagellar M-ring protein FliF
MFFREFIIQINTLLRNLSPAKKITLVSLVAGTIAGFIFLMTWTGSHDFHPLYTHLAPEDAGAILTQLKDKKIPYQISANGSSILVPAEQIYETRMDLAAQGLPQGSGVGFEVFDNTKLGMTEFVQNVNYQRALQGELSRTINRFTEVESSRVHIVMPSKSLFIEEEEPATASVVVKLRPGKWLSRDQVQGIVHLVSSSVSRLKPENVAVVDSSGKILTGFQDSSGLSRLSSDQLEYREKVERRLEKRVKTMLEKALGLENAIVRVSCALDFTRQEMTEERYYPDNKVIRSEQYFNEISGGSETMPMGVPGVRTNLTKKSKGSKANSRSEFQKQDRTVNYEIGKLTSHILEPVGKIKRISVAVIVDGTYQNMDNGSGEKQWKYVPRSPEEMAKLENIVKSAVNFDSERGDKIEVANIPFESDKTMQTIEEKPKEGWLDRFKQFNTPLRYAFLGLFLLFSFLFVVRPLINWLTSASGGEVEILKQLPKTVGEIEREYSQGISGRPNINPMTDIITSDKELSMGVMKDWLKES